MERRRRKRFAKRVSVRFGESDFSHSGLTRDVSGCGAFVYSAKYIPPVGTRVHVEVTLPGDRPVYLEAVVRRRRQLPAHVQPLEQSGFAVAFLTPDEIFADFLPQDVGTQFDLEIESVAALRKVYQQEVRRGGVFVRTEAELAPDTQVTIGLRLAFADKSVALPGRVVQAMTAGLRGLAVAFDDMGQVEQLLRPYLE